MPLYDDTELDIEYGPGCEFETIEDAMMIRERPNVSRSENADYGSNDISDEEIDKLLGITETNSLTYKPFTKEDIYKHLKWINEQHLENFGPEEERTPEEEAELSKQLDELFGQKEIK